MKLLLIILFIPLFGKAQKKDTSGLTVLIYSDTSKYSYGALKYTTLKQMLGYRVIEQGKENVYLTDKKKPVASYIIVLELNKKIFLKDPIEKTTDPKTGNDSLGLKSSYLLKRL